MARDMVARWMVVIVAVLDCRTGEVEERDGHAALARIAHRPLDRVAPRWSIDRDVAGMPTAVRC